MSIQIGFGRDSITPRDPGLPLGGWPEPRPASGVESDIDCRVLAVSDSANELVLVVFDVLGLSSEVTSLIRRSVAEESGVAEAHVHVSATHTHTAPQVPPFLASDGSVGDPSYIEVLVDSAVLATTEAVASRQPASVGVGEGVCHLGVNRRRRGPGRTGHEATACRRFGDV